MNAVNPGVIVTEVHKTAGMEDAAYARFLEHSRSTHALGRVGTADEVGAAYCLLCESLEYPESRDWVIFNLRPEDNAVYRAAGEADDEACGRDDAVIGAQHGGAQPADPVDHVVFFVAGIGNGV